MRLAELLVIIAGVVVGVLKGPAAASALTTTLTALTPAFSKIIGNHTLKVGAEIRVLRNNYFQSNNPAGLFQINAKMTAANPQ